LLRKSSLYICILSQEAGSTLGARAQGSLDNSLIYKTLHDDLADVAQANHTLISYSWVSLPLVYTQLVTMAVYLYFFFTLFSSQYLQPTQYRLDEATGTYTPAAPGHPQAVNLVGHDDTIMDIHVPIFTLLKFIFYFGWLHVAEVLINPFGEDDEDFDVNYLIDRNLQASYLMVEGGDQEWQEVEDPYEGSLPNQLPHTVESFKTTYPPPAFPTDGIRQTLTLHDMKWTEQEEEVEEEEETEPAGPLLLPQGNKLRVQEVRRGSQVSSIVFARVLGDSQGAARHGSMLDP
jgi:hypothetical protein